MEYLGGVDDLADHLRDFGPGPERRVGVLVDHLVAGSKESRIADGRRAARPSASTCSSSATRSSTSGRRSSPSGSASRAWPDVPRDVEWKHGICAAARLAARATRPTSPARGSRSSARVTSYADLEPALLGRVEELIDFVTA